jgi:hypothetical protein
MIILDSRGSAGQAGEEFDVPESVTEEVPADVIEEPASNKQVDQKKVKSQKATKSKSKNEKDGEDESEDIPF